jgi:hypothetical protein
MITYRIVPRRGTYRIEAVEAEGGYRVLGTWRTDEAVMSCLKDLQAKALRDSYEPAHGEPGWWPQRFTQA